jgi:hypothetical protein
MMREWTGSYITEVSGPHDVLGNGKVFTGWRAAVDEVLLYATLVPATPIAVSALVPTYTYEAMRQAYDR